MMRIDAHQHFWQLARGDYGWLTEEDHPSIYRDFLPSDLLPLLKDGRIGKTILVQAAPSVAETEFLLDLAGNTSFVAGVVGWVDFEAANAPDTIDRLVRNGKLIGLRPMIQDLANDGWMLDSHIDPAIAAMKANGLRFDALIKPRHLRTLLKFLDRHPELPVVIDHSAKPDIAGGGIDRWADDIRRIARNTHAVCKLSGLVTEAHMGFSTEDIRPYVDALLDAFGAERLMWGSDWPVVNEAWRAPMLVGSGGISEPEPYASWLAIAEGLTGFLPADERDRLFGGTACEFYGIA